jgi:hypothetical protein
VGELVSENGVAETVVEEAVAVVLQDCQLKQLSLIEYLACEEH